MIKMPFRAIVMVSILLSFVSFFSVQMIEYTQSGDEMPNGDPPRDPDDPRIFAEDEGFEIDLTEFFHIDSYYSILLPIVVGIVFCFLVIVLYFRLLNSEELQLYINSNITMASIDGKIGSWGKKFEIAKEVIIEIHTRTRQVTITLPKNNANPEDFGFIDGPVIFVKSSFDSIMSTLLSVKLYLKHNEAC